MKAWEMIKMLEKNPNLRFTCENNKSGAVVTRINKRLICLFDNENTWGYEFIFEKDWQLVRTPVTWREALQAWVDGKTIKWFCPPNNEGMISRTFYPSCTGPDRDMLKTGTWYIEE